MPVHVAGAVTVTCRSLFSDSSCRQRGSLSDYIDNPEASLKHRLCVVNKHLGEMRRGGRETGRQRKKRMKAADSHAGMEKHICRGFFFLAKASSLFFAIYS